MIKRVSFYIAIALVVFFISCAFKPIHSEKITWLADDYETENLYQYPSEQPSDYVAQSIPFIGKRFVGFKEALAFKESQGKYNKVNSLGYLGKYQFGTSTLKSVGISNSIRFLKNPKLQEKAFIALLKKNKYILRNIIKKYRGKMIDGVKITESGILAAAHLGGAGSVKVFLQSNGKRKVRDDYGTSIKSYLRDFGGFETHNIIADLNAKAH